MTDEAAAPAETDIDGVANLGLAAARRAIAIEGEVPPLAGALVVQLESPSTIAEGRVPWGMYPHVAATAGPMRVAASATSAADLHAAAAGRPIVIAGRNLHRLAGAAQLVEALAATDRVVVVEMGWPSTWRPAGAVAVPHHVRSQPGQRPRRGRGARAGRLAGPSGAERAGGCVTGYGVRSTAARSDPSM